MALNSSRPRLNCITENLGLIISPQAVKSPLPLLNNSQSSSKDLLSPARPVLHLFPRDNPDAPFVPLRTKQLFHSCSVSRNDLDSESEFSEWYESSDEDEPKPRAQSCSSQVTGKDTTTFTKLTISTPKCLPNLSSSPQQPVLKSALKRQSSAAYSPASSTFSNTSSSTCFDAPTPTDERPRSACLGVQVVEPLEDIAALRDLRKTFRYRDQGPLNLKSNFGLPASPKDVFRKDQFLSFKIYERTPPATSSVARYEWERSQVKSPVILRN